MFLSVDIPCDPSAPARARRAVEQLASAMPPEVVADVKLLVSELITNSVKYGRSKAVLLELGCDEDRRLRVEVVDDGGGFVPVERNRPATEVGGWGLHLVQSLADRWGVVGDTSRVWFEIGWRSRGQTSLAA